LIYIFFNSSMKQSAGDSTSLSVTYKRTHSAVTK